MVELTGKRILLIVGGGIAAYKALEFVRLVRKAGGSVRAVLTKGGAQFVTPLSLGALTEDAVYQDLWSLTDEAAMGHIRLSREADLVVVAPATADLVAKMAAGLAGDLATTLLLATDKKVLIAPAMNVRMWEHAATRANLETLKARGIALVGPGEGEMACGEFGLGRMAEPAEILDAAAAMLGSGPLAGITALVTSGPTHEPIDPVRYIANRSSGRQGHAIAASLAAAGARTLLVSGPVALPDPPGVRTVKVETALEMETAVRAALAESTPIDVAVCAAAVADWRVESVADRKLKKEQGGTGKTLDLAANPDILQWLAQSGKSRPKIVIGFAAETEDLVDNARAKLARKGCDWILANAVGPGTAVFGGDDNSVTLVTRGSVEPWPAMSKRAVADRLVARIAETLAAGRGGALAVRP